MPTATLEELMEAGVHFGHQTNKWNPKMKPYIWGERNGIYIIDLTKTTKLLDQACQLVKDYSAKGKKIVFVGTKKQAANVVQEQAERCGCFFINRRWLGGTLTNFETIRTRINKLRELEELKSSGHFDKLPKKEVAVLTRQLEKLDRTLGGLKEMRGMPDLLFIVDQKRELNAVLEANKAHIPVVGVVDTNCDPDGIDYVIPGNDDAIRSITIITTKIADAIIEGQDIRKKKFEEEVIKGQKAKAASEVTVSKLEEGEGTEGAEGTSATQPTEAEAAPAEPEAVETAVAE
ncbi:MAG: 30S ribosomal protein S2 [Cyanobacteria bacterium HKST-UBA04]|nr:30S ribosomal protein S2 [Cyanobacteria bacterium HKST-UBA04]